MKRSLRVVIVTASLFCLALSAWAQQEVMPLEHQRSRPVYEIQVITPHDEVQHVIDVKPNPHTASGGVDSVVQSSPVLTSATVTAGKGWDGVGTTMPGFTMTGERVCR